MMQNNRAMNFDNGTLPETLFTKYAQAALPHIIGWAAKDGVGTSYNIRSELIEHGYGFEVESHPDYSTLVLEEARRLTLTSLPEALPCALALQNADQRCEAGSHSLDPDLEFSPNHDDLYAHCLSDLLDFLIVVLEVIQSLTPTSDEIRGAYFKCVNARSKRLELEESPCCFTVPVVNIVAPRIPIKLSPMLQLSPFPLSEKKQLFRLEHVTGNFVKLDTFLHSEYKLEQVPGGDEQSFDDLLAEARRVMTALRLSQTGHVGADTGFFVNAAGMGRLYRFHEFQVPFSIKPYMLHSESIERVTLLASSLRRGAETTLELALHRFMVAYGRSSPEDKLIDTVIALESTLGANVHNELKFRLALRGAIVLCGQFPFEQINDLIRVAYDIRSQIVHSGVRLSHVGKGNARKLRDLGVAEGSLPHRLHDLARPILAHFVERVAAGLKIEDVVDEIDGRLAAAVTHFAQTTDAIS